MNFYAVTKIKEAYTARLVGPTQLTVRTTENGQTTEQTVDVPAPKVFGLAKVFAGEAAPTTEQMVALFTPDALTVAKQAKAAQIYATGRTQTLAIFEQLPKGVQAQFQPVLDAADRAAKTGDIATAKNIIETCVVPQALASTQAALVAVLGPLVTKAAALAAATTVDAVNAI